MTVTFILLLCGGLSQLVRDLNISTEETLIHVFLVDTVELRNDEGGDVGRDHLEYMFDGLGADLQLGLQSCPQACGLTVPVTMQQSLHFRGSDFAKWRDLGQLRWVDGERAVTVLV